MSIMLAVARGFEGTQVEWVPSPHASLSEAAAEEPANGVYLVARTYHGGRVLELDAHFDRMERSAAAQGWPVRIPREQLRRLLREMLQRMARGVLREPARVVPSEQSGVAPQGAPSSGDGRFRITTVLDDPPWYRVAMEPAVDVDPELLRRGVHCSVHRGAVRADAEVKSTAWMAERRMLARESEAHAEASAPAEDAAPAEPVYEDLLAREDGAILEGASSNFYACIGSVLHTAGEGMLQGIARRIVLTVSEEMAPEVTVKLQPVTIAQLQSGAIEEAFITSATRGVVPVRSIDSVLLDPPGPITMEISRRYDAWLKQHLKPL